MKTQLLEDIGQSAGLPPAPSQAADRSIARTAAAQGPAIAMKTEPAPRRPAGGVWRKRPAGEPPASTQQQPEAPAPVALDRVFEEIAALEAQFVQPAHEVAAAQVEPPPAPAGGPHEETTAPNPLRSVAAPHGPVFYFTEPLPASHAANPVTPAATGRTRPARHYVLVGACLLSAVLLLLGGRWLQQERNDAAAIAAAAAQAPAPQAAAATPVEPAVAASMPAPAPDVPPLVMLEPDPPAPPPVPAPIIRKAREPARAAARPAKPGTKRAPVRPLVRAAAIPAQRPPAPESAMAATLRACRERGYHATQCIRRGCGLTAYGFACRGR